MSKKYILLKDLPWAKAGSEWGEEDNDGKGGHYLIIDKKGWKEHSHFFPADTFHDWFEEKKPEVEFSQNNKKAILYYIVENRFRTSCPGGETWAIDEHDFERWLDAHTAKTEET